jgi:hypothetical protein
MAEASIVRRSLVLPPSAILLADITVGTATTNVDISGLSIGKGDEILLVSDIKNAITNSFVGSIFVNGETTITNYYSQRLLANGTSLSSLRANSSVYTTTTDDASTIAISKIKLTNNGYIVSQNDNVREYGLNTIMLEARYIASTFTATSITSLRINSNLTNAIGIGSRFQLYKVGA